MKRLIFAVWAVAGMTGLAFSAAESSNIYTDGTCIKQGLPGQSATKSGCDSIGGVWRSKKGAEMIGAAEQRGNAAKETKAPKAGRNAPNASEGETPAQSGQR